MGQNKPAVRGALTDPAVDDDVVVGLQAPPVGVAVGRRPGPGRPERFVIVDRQTPRKVDRAGDVSAAQRPPSSRLVSGVTNAPPYSAVERTSSSGRPAAT